MNPNKIRETPYTKNIFIDIIFTDIHIPGAGVGVDPNNPPEGAGAGDFAPKSPPALFAAGAIGVVVVKLVIVYFVWYKFNAD